MQHSDRMVPTSITLAIVFANGVDHGRAGDDDHRKCLGIAPTHRFGFTVSKHLSEPLAILVRIVDHAVSCLFDHE